MLHQSFTLASIFYAAKIIQSCYAVLVECECSFTTLVNQTVNQLTAVIVQDSVGS